MIYGEGHDRLPGLPPVPKEYVRKAEMLLKHADTYSTFSDERRAQTVKRILNGIQPEHRYELARALQELVNSEDTETPKRVENRNMFANALLSGLMKQMI